MLPQKISILQINDPYRGYLISKKKKKKSRDPNISASKYLCCMNCYKLVPMHFVLCLNHQFLQTVHRFILKRSGFSMIEAKERIFQKERSLNFN